MVVDIWKGGGMKSNPVYIFVAVVLMSSCMLPSVGRCEESQFRAAVTKYFLQNHRAIPIRSNGNVRSGDVIRLPEEATLVSRDVCYNMPSPVYRSLASGSYDISILGATEFALNIPINKIIEFQANIGQNSKISSQVVLDPFSEEQPLGGFSILDNPRRDSRCEVIKDIFNHTSDADVLVTRVFHGRQSARISLGFSNSSNISAAATLPKLKKWLGNVADVEAKVQNDSIIILSSSFSPAPQSLAIQSAFVDLNLLAAIHLRVSARSAYDLELMVNEYIRSEDPGALKKLAREIDIALKSFGYNWMDANQLYMMVFAGKNSRYPIEKASEQEIVSFSNVAAATEIAATLRR